MKLGLTCFSLKRWELPVNSVALLHSHKAQTSQISMASWVALFGVELVFHRGKFDLHLRRQQTVRTSMDFDQWLWSPKSQICLELPNERSKAMGQSQNDVQGDQNYIFTKVSKSTFTPPWISRVLFLGFLTNIALLEANFMATLWNRHCFSSLRLALFLSMISLAPSWSMRLFHRGKETLLFQFQMFLFVLFCFVVVDYLQLLKLSS